MVANKFIVGQFYQNYLTSGLYMRVDKILNRDKTGTRLLATWWKLDDATKRKINMDVQQEVVIPEGEQGNWIRVS